MLFGMLGRLLRAVARFTSGDARDDLEHVGGELVRLEGRARQDPASSR